jgi:hemerythrin superfamily protein
LRANAFADLRKVSRKTSPSSKDAVALLTQDHKDVKKLFKAYEKLVKEDASSDEKQRVADQICSALTIHATIEEEIFYPAAREVLDEQNLLDEAEVEHASVKELIAQIQASDPDMENYDAKVHVLGEYVDHHVKEEEGEMFPRAKKADLDLAALGAELEQRKGELMTEAVAAADA